MIEHDAFRDLWSAELDGGLVVEREDVDKIEPGAVTIFPDEAQASATTSSIPQLTRALARVRHAARTSCDPADVAGSEEAARGARRRSPTSTSSTAAST